MTNDQGQMTFVKPVDKTSAQEGKFLLLGADRSQSLMNEEKFWC
ncbi:MAG: hypothetical protein ACOCXU_00530 [Coleofasciculus sp.]